ncbi:MAG: N-acetyltransferase [Phycisphaerae bacterium]|jgi:amino-acid N-acetyltransferase
MKVRSAKITDAKAIHSLINFYAEENKMLFRSMADVYENLQSFVVAELDGRVVGCCALQVIWSDLAEIKSLAVEEANSKKGIGKSLVTATIEKAALLGAPQVVALTLYPDFFKKLGFEVIQMDKLPMKVWSDCAKCSKQQNCDEIAVMKTVPRQ